MSNQTRASCWLAGGGLAALVFVLAIGAPAQRRPAARTSRALPKDASPPAYYKDAVEGHATTSGASLSSIVKGKPAGIEVGQYAPDFELEPIQAYADFTRWLGDKAPKSAAQKVMLSDFAHKAPIILLFGSYT